MGRVSFLVSLLSATTCALGAEWIGEVKGDYQCKCYSDNACWPKTADWSALNATVDGKLQVAIPPGAVCHKALENSAPGNQTNAAIATYNQAACSQVQANWVNEQYLTDHPIANLWPLYTNNTCLPTDNPDALCTRGFYGEYVILATKKEHIKAGVDFAREKNLRLIIRNTGHDFMGRSTGYGSLIINTHSFKEATFSKTYSGPGNWSGSVATVGAGVQGRELYRQAFKQEPPVVIVGGECPTVGWAGGYIQGGGHGPLTSIYGMGADNVLSFEAITAAGEYVTANAEKNPDLFWALKGGGPSTFAVVTSITVKTFPEVPVAGTILNINATHTNDTKVFNEGFHIFHNLSNHYTDHGMFVYFELSTGRLHIAPFVGPRMDEAKVKSVLKPLFDALDAAKIPYDAYTRAFPTFFEFYIDMFEDEQPNQNSVVGGRLFTQKDIAERSEQISEALLFANQPVPDTAGFSVGHIVNPGYGVPVVDNAIHPKWRNASSFVITNLLMVGDEGWATKQLRNEQQTNIVGKALREAGPDGATYVNEGDLYEPNWQESYWGSNYARLLELRKKWDPTGVFYTQTTPGTENWEVIDFGTKLCKKVT
ncbi:FAD/FMN-containing isoamyl alcohol oxidase-like protein MreA [Aaosphaeria arxii CBS 175.79]|uniref:FAD/FMN-containing isoamyl alcohol oxidase-like protein MreA n=1 Tax=Aaosphaeria arxii CBS 175.79 TaxID=1450172 RepID=A0A6A5Y2C5_9PLEO|nr:FAD/FMN-containing isoamyl alcohol oxidase-like protein MreA [Aaosphaeria arxii CBS 175.79]KAF2019041.1 FAD/FMN-containing isoamyl alcohol oxidase-like protein MreA [Aaosphaeria arxii CBS 175.79]